MEQLELFGPPTVSHQTEDGVGWFAIRDYEHRQEGLRDGTGAFLTFQSKNANDQWGDWVLLNGGLIDRTPGMEQGDLDLIVTVDGKTGGFAIVGNMVHAGGPPPGLVPINDSQMDIGSTALRINTVWARLLGIETVGKQINIGGVWQWCDCVPVLTQQGTMWMPVFKAAN